MKKINYNDLTHYFLRPHSGLPRSYIDSCEKFFRELKNLIIRMSSHMIDQAAVKFWPWTSTVTSKGGASCPAPTQGNTCGDCRACWNRGSSNVSYGKH